MSRQPSASRISASSGAVRGSSASESNVAMLACPCMFDCPGRTNTLSGLVAAPGTAGRGTPYVDLPVITRPRFGIVRMKAVTDDASVRESEP